MNLGPEVWTAIVYCVLIVVFSTVLFIQGIVNLVTGKVSKFGIDAFLLSIDSQLRKIFTFKNTARHGGGAKGVRVMGILAILIGVQTLRAAIAVYYVLISPFIR